MFEEQLKAFLDAVKADEGLQEKLRSVSSFQELVDIANYAGHPEVNMAIASAQNDLTDEDLESASGGTLTGAGYDPISTIVALNNWMNDNVSDKSAVNLLIPSHGHRKNRKSI
ncbi:MAG: Nif11-like leader peptide family natural product precursor [Synechococcus sp.]|nr:Nif11-like leader peptide family natural product precursor [Synechococcus sp.]